MKSFIIIFLFLLYLTNFSTLNFYSTKKNILIEVDILGSIGRNRGPSIFNRGLYEILPYNSGKCNFISSNISTPIFAKNKTDYFFSQIRVSMNPFLINGSK